MSKKILFFGNERLATGVQTSAPTLRTLLAAGYEIAAIIVAQSPPSRSRHGRQLEIALVAEEHNIPLLSPANLSQARQQLASFGAEAAVLIAYGKLVPQTVLDLFPKGIINVHPSLLPLRRGPTPIENAILNGAIATGVSLMKLAIKMDTGPVYTQRIVPLGVNETKQELVDNLAGLGAAMVLENLPDILANSLKPKPQDGQAATYTQFVTKNDGLLDWTKPALSLEREVRAYAGWPRSRAKLGATDVIITKAHVTNGQGQPGSLWLEAKQLGIYTSEGILAVERLIPAGKQDMTAAAFMAGYKLSG